MIFAPRHIMRRVRFYICPLIFYRIRAVVPALAGAPKQSKAAGLTVRQKGCVFGFKLKRKRILGRSPKQLGGSFDKGFDFFFTRAP